MGPGHKRERPTIAAIGPHSVAGMCDKAHCKWIIRQAVFSRIYWKVIAP